nr:ABC transporter ATP-binding protein [Burkholderiales bacterium]
KVMGYDVLSQVIKAKKNLGVVPQELAFDPFLTVYQTLKFQSGLYGVKNNKAWLDEIIQRMYLEDKINSRTRSLSGGMKRRSMMAQALVHKPSLIILDEPTAGVDVEIRKNLWEFILELHKNGHTILLTTHYLEEVEKLCNNIIMIDKGNIIATSAKNELIKKAGELGSTLQVETFYGKFSNKLNSLLLNKEGNIFTLRLDNHNQLFSILEILKNDGISLENININRPNLEDIFINYLHRT